MSGWNLQTRKSVALLLQIHISRNPDKKCAAGSLFAGLSVLCTNSLFTNAGTAVPFLVGMDKGYFIIFVA